ncbi:MAG: hypothetical protein ACKOPT_03665 [Cyanobium sp.]
MRIHRDRSQYRDPQRVTLRKEVVAVERFGEGQAPARLARFTLAPLGSCQPRPPGDRDPIQSRSPSARLRP